MQRIFTSSLRYKYTHDSMSLSLYINTEATKYEVQFVTLRAEKNIDEVTLPISPSLRYLDYGKCLPSSLDGAKRIQCGKKHPPYRRKNGVDRYLRPKTYALD